MSAIPRHLLPDTASVDAQGRLSIGGVDVIDLADEHGTPLFVYDEEHLRARCREAVAAFGPDLAIYASKAFLCRAMVQLVDEEGLRLDVATGGELHVALAAGFPPGAPRASTATTRASTSCGGPARHGVGRTVVDSFDELDRLDALHAEDGLVPSVLLRVTPGIEAHTHEYVKTGQDDSKFGFGLAAGDAQRGGRARRRVVRRSTSSVSTPTSAARCSRSTRSVLRSRCSPRSCGPARCPS